jgi:hypothetical protein
MELDSTASTPSQSPALIVTDLPEMHSGIDTTTVHSPASSIASSSNEPIMPQTPPPASGTNIILDAQGQKVAEIPAVALLSEISSKVDRMPSKMASKVDASAPGPWTSDTFQQRHTLESILPDHTPTAHQPAVVGNPFGSARSIGKLGATNRQTSTSSDTNLPPAVSLNRTFIHELSSS